MRDRHQPREEFVARLEQEIRRGVRRLPQRSTWLDWVGQTPLRLAAVVLTLVALAMGAGAAVTAAAYEAQANDHRDLLVSVYQRRLELARRQVDVAATALRDVERQVQIGTAQEEALREAQTHLAEVQSQMHVLALQLEEVRLTGREALDETAAPLVARRDFVSERVRAQMEAPSARLAFEQWRLRMAERRAEIGVGSRDDVDAVRNRILELEAALEWARLRLDLRRQVVDGLISAPRADLQADLIAAEQRRSAVIPQVETARRTVERLRMLVDVGRATNVQLKEEELKLLELETQLARIELDLTVARQKLGQ